MKVRTIMSEDLLKVEEFMAEHLYNDEPLARTLDASDVPAVGHGVASLFAAQGLSLMAVDEDGSIMGVCCNDKFPQPIPYIYCCTRSDEKFQKLFDYLQEASHINDIAHGAMEIRVLCVNPNYRQQGVATALVDESINKALEEGYPWVKMYCTSEFSSKMLAKKGWTLLYSRSYQDLKEKAVPDLPVPDPPHTHINVYIKATKD